MKDLKSQLVEFAAKRAVSEIVRITAYSLEKQARKEIQSRRLRKIVNKTSTSKERTSPMARQQTARFEPSSSRQNAAESAQGGNSRNPKEPVEFWVNTVIVKNDGDAPIRILTGRPLKSFNENRGVTTNNEEFNRVNVLNNAFVRMLKDDADKLNLGESKYYSPQGTPMGEDGEPCFTAGIYLQLHREETDYASAEAEKIDLEAAEADSLRKLFG